MDVPPATVAADRRAIEFTGEWKEFLPVAATNALLIICTLGIYRFWAVARERRYLWSRTQLIDDSLEWTGTGKEMFVGFLVVVLVLAPFFLFVQFLFPALVARGKETAAFGLFVLFYVALIFLYGLARFRALRYRLSRTFWHGIRGGSDNPGWSYGGEYLGRYWLIFMTAFIVFPWATTRLWNSRWNAMSFGQIRFRANLDAEGLKLRWALLYLAPLALMVALFVVGMSVSGSGEQSDNIAFGVIAIGGAVLFYIAIPLMTLNWFAGFYRNAAQATDFGDLEFEFDATTWQWLKLYLGNIALAIVTLGFGLTYWGYRKWSFIIRHLQVYGAIDVSDLRQSTTYAPREAEGFADAFDVGAI